MTADAMWQGLVARWLPEDAPPDDRMRTYYGSKYALAKQLHDAGGLHSILEIGVRAGYSAYAMLSANPDAYYLGLDADVGGWGGVAGWLDRARDTLAGFPRVLLRKANTQHLETLGEEPGTFSLAHVDGDHSYDGCYHDIQLAAACALNILVDDYDAMRAVQAATDHFLVRHGHLWAYQYLGEGNFMGAMLLTRRPL